MTTQRTTEVTETRPAARTGDEAGSDTAPP